MGNTTKRLRQKTAGILSIDIWNRPLNSKFDIIKDDDFREANASFKAALAELKLEGKGSVDHDPI